MAVGVSYACEVPEIEGDYAGVMTVAVVACQRAIVLVFVAEDEIKIC